MTLLGLVGTLLAAGCGGEDDPPRNRDSAVGADTGVTPGTDTGVTPDTATAATLTINPPTHDFGPTSVGAMSGEQTFTIANTGTAATGAMAVTISGATGEFSFPANACAGPIAAGQSCPVAVRFTPKTPGVKTLTITARTADGRTTPPATITGEGVVSELSALQTVLNVGGVIGEAPGQVTATIRNVGSFRTGTIMVGALAGANAAQFGIAANTCAGKQLEGGQECRIDFTFTPVGEPGPRTATLELTATPGSTERLTLNGVATRVGVLDVTDPSADPAVVTFPNTITNTTSGAQTITVKNTGGQAVPAVTVTLQDPSNFSYTSQCGALPPNQSCPILVRFAPSSAGAKSTVLTISGAAGTGVNVTLSGTATTGPNLVSVTPAQNFGPVNVNNFSSNVTFQFTNNGGAPTPTLSSRIDGPNFDEVSSTCRNAAVAAGESCNVVVRFRPTNPGDKTANLIVEGGGLRATSSLSGTGVITAITSSAGSISFGSVALEATAGPTALTLTNTAMTATGPIAVTLENNAGADFAIDPAGTTCGLMGLAPNAMCALSVSFTPKALGARTATLRVVVAGVTLDFGLTGTGLPLFEYVASPTTFSPQTVNLNGSSITYTVTARRATMLTVALAAGGPPANFIITADTCSGATIGAGTPTCDVTVQFTPRGAPGEKTGTLTLTPTAAGLTAITVPLTATAAGPLVWSGSAAFGSEIINTGPFGPRTFTLTNNGATSLVISTVAPPLAAPFQITATTCSGVSLAAAGTGTNTCTIDVTFDPTTVGAATAVFTATATTSETATITVTGTGEAPPPPTPLPDLVASVPALNFNATVVGAQTDTQSFLLSNNGAVGTNVTAITVAPSTTNYVIESGLSGGCPSGAFALAGQTSCTVTVRFRPVLGAEGPRNSTVDIAAGGTPITQVTVGGQALAALTIAADAASFGDVITNNAAVLNQSRTITVTNRSSAAVALGTKTVTSAGVPYGQVTIGADTCTVGAVLAANTGSCSFTITLNNPGGSGPLSIDVNVPATVSGVGTSLGTVTTSLSANIVGDADLEFALYTGATNIDLGSVPQGSQSTIFTVAVTNVGATTSGPLSSAAFAAPAALTLGSTEFSIIGADPGDCTAGQTLAAGASCNVRVRFNPTAATAVGAQATATLQLREESGSGNSETAALLTFRGVALAAGSPTLAPTVVDFGLQAPGTQPTTTLTLNRGAVDYVVPTFTAMNDVGSDFTVVPGGTCGVGIFTTLTATNSSCTITVRFTPTPLMGGAGGWRQARVVVAGMATEPSAAVVGRVSQATLSVTNAAAAAFGPATAGSTVARTLVIRNTGNLASTSASAAVSGADAAQFVVTDGCAGQTVAPNATCNVTVTYSPTGAPGARNTTLTVLGGSIPITQALSGTVVIPPVVEFTSAGPVALATTPVSSTSVGMNVTITNSAVGGLTSGPIALSIDDADNFAFTPGAGCAAATSTGLAPGDTCVVSVQFKPQTLGSGAFSTTLRVTADPGAATPDTIQLTGTAVSALTSSPGSLSFAAQTAGMGSGQQMLTITNTGVAPVTNPAVTLGGSNPGDFRIAVEDCSTKTLVTSDTCTIQVVFLPGTPGPKTASVDVNGGAAGRSVSVGLSGTGQ